MQLKATWTHKAALEYARQELGPLNKAQTQAARVAADIPIEVTINKTAKELYGVTEPVLDSEGTVLRALDRLQGSITHEQIEVIVRIIEMRATESGYFE